MTTLVCAVSAIEAWHGHCVSYHITARRHCHCVTTSQYIVHHVFCLVKMRSCMQVANGCEIERVGGLIQSEGEVCQGFKLETHYSLLPGLDSGTQKPGLHAFLSCIHQSLTLSSTHAPQQSPQLFGPHPILDTCTSVCMLPCTPQYACHLMHLSMRAPLCACHLLHACYHLHLCMPPHAPQYACHLLHLSMRAPHVLMHPTSMPLVCSCTPAL